MQTTYYALIVVAELMTTGKFYISPKTPLFREKELCQMVEKRVQNQYRPRKDIKSLVTICNPVSFVGEDDTGD